MGFSHHPDYNYPESYFDIGIAKLNGSVPSNAFGTIRPICLPTISSENIGQYFSIHLLLDCIALNDAFLLFEIKGPLILLC